MCAWWRSSYPFVSRYSQRIVVPLSRTTRSILRSIHMYTHTLMRDSFFHVSCVIIHVLSANSIQCMFSIHLHLCEMYRHIVFSAKTNAVRLRSNRMNNGIIFPLKQNYHNNSVTVFSDIFLQFVFFFFSK